MDNNVCYGKNLVFSFSGLSLSGRHKKHNEDKQNMYKTNTTHCQNICKIE
jgi:hypothetical protein